MVAGGFGAHRNGLLQVLDRFVPALEFRQREPVNVEMGGIAASLPQGRFGHSQRRLILAASILAERLLIVGIELGQARGAPKEKENQRCQQRIRAVPEIPPSAPIVHG